jgi:hypothetical protein
MSRAPRALRSLSPAFVATVVADKAFFAMSAANHNTEVTLDFPTIVTEYHTYKRVVREDLVADLVQWDEQWDGSFLSGPAHASVRLRQICSVR